MTIKKNKRRFDPRYFMDEKMEELDEASPDVPAMRPAGTRRERRKINILEEKNNISHYGQIEEDLSALADLETWRTLALAAGKLFEIWGPLIAIGGFVEVIRRAFDFLKASPEIGAEGAFKEAVDYAEKKKRAPEV